MELKAALRDGVVDGMAEVVHQRQHRVEGLEVAVDEVPEMQGEGRLRGADRFRRRSTEPVPSPDPERNTANGCTTHHNSLLDHPCFR